jgi:hypothetical protein
MYARVDCTLPAAREAFDPTMRLVMTTSTSRWPRAGS